MIRVGGLTLDPVKLLIAWAVFTVLFGLGCVAVKAAWSERAEYRRARRRMRASARVRRASQVRDR